MNEQDLGYTTTVTASIRVWRLLLAEESGWVADALTKAIADGHQDEQGRLVVTLSEQLSTLVLPTLDHKIAEAAND